MAEQFKYFAFISYSSRDMEWGKRLQRKLEHYRMSAMLCSEYGWKRNPIKPVFFAPTDIQPGGLTEELQERLKASKNLIVICSPNSARSEWVGKEIEYFHNLGRTKQIHFFIVDGQPNSGNPGTDCFNPLVDTLGLPEILAANIHERIYRWPWMNKERAYVQLISKLLGVEFDTIWHRHRRLLIRKTAAWALGVLCVIATVIGVWRANLPADVTVRLLEASVHNENLPPLKDALVTLALNNETKTDTIASIEGAALFTNIPHRHLGKRTRIVVTCRNFSYTDTSIVLSKDLVLSVRRDPSVFGNVSFRLFRQNDSVEEFVYNMSLQVAGRQVTSDDEARVRLFIPLEEQDTVYSITSDTVTLIDNVIKMPLGGSEIIRVQ